VEAIETWCGDWADQFDQGWSNDSLKEWVGKKVTVRTPEGVEPARGATAVVVGYSCDTIFLNDQPVHRFSFITDLGVQISLYDKMTVEETEE
jgi:hypothetical protein